MRPHVRRCRRTSRAPGATTPSLHHPRASTTVLAALALVSGLLTAPPMPLGAQERPAWSVSVRGSYLPLYGGDATVGGVSSWAGTLALSRTVGEDASDEVSLFYTLSPRDGHPQDGAPRIQIAGLLVTGSEGPMSDWSPLFGVGAGVLDVAAARTAPCEPPECFAEGGPSFENATLAVLIGRIGVDARVGERFRLVLDLRAHWPPFDDDAGESGELRLDLGAGVRYLF